MHLLLLLLLLCTLTYGRKKIVREEKNGEGKDGNNGRTPPRRPDVDTGQGEKKGPDGLIR